MCHVDVALPKKIPCLMSTTGIFYGAFGFVGFQKSRCLFGNNTNLGIFGPVHFGSRGPCQAKISHPAILYGTTEAPCFFAAFGGPRKMPGGWCCWVLAMVT